MTAADRTPGRAQPGPASAEEDGGPGGQPSLNQDFNADSLYQLRAAVAAHSAAAGLAPARVYDVVAAAHEMAANAVRHGAGHGRLRLHHDHLALYCQVSDNGPGSGDQDAGPGPGGAPSWPVQHGHGLWIIEQVADQFTIDYGADGTIATACFTISSPPGTAEHTTA